MTTLAENEPINTMRSVDPGFRKTQSELRMCGSWTQKTATFAFVVAVCALPFSIASEFWLAIFTTAGILALGAVGLNLLTGYLGEASLGHAFFLSVGCYSGILFGQKFELPLPVWMLGVLAVGGLVGAVAGPLALRLSGSHLLMVSLGLVFLGNYIFSNWRSLTGGPGGTSVSLPMALGPIDFDALTIGALTYKPSQGLALLAWICCLVALLVVRNISRSRRGRGMTAIRDNALAAEVAGVSLTRTKIGAFVVSSALAALAGALYAQQISYIEPGAFNLNMSIKFVAILVIGGTAATFGPVVGGIFVALVPALLDRYLGTSLPFIHSPNESGFGMTPAELSNLVYALLLVIFLIYEPRGLNGLFLRIRSFFSRRFPSPQSKETA